MDGIGVAENMDRWGGGGALVNVVVNHRDP
jgi:hypothetical protein